jgi:adenosylhomocysteine nucleosidase
MLGILCGLESEAAIARRIPDALVACAAARPGKARLLARDLVDQGATRLMSFGVTGGLKSDLPIGALLIGSRVVSAKGLWTCDEAWGEALAQKLPQAQRGAVWGSETLVPTAEDKQRLHDTSGCLIVDMESQCAAEVAMEAKIPLAVLRAVCDTADMHVPPVVMAAIGEDGRVSGFRMFRHLVRHPRDISDLLHVARGINRALGALKATLSAFGNP